MAAVTGDSLDLSGRGFAQDPSAPDPIRPHAGDTVAAPRDEFDDLFNYDAQIDDVFRDTNNDGSRNTGNNRDDAARGLGIDEQVKVRKPRPKQAKLDESRLLSAKGILALRKITKDRLKLRGKGHEFSDVSRLLNMYQLWLDDLFPKARFADGLSIIEKLGHSRRMQTLRREWIDEERRPRHITPPMEDANTSVDGGKTLMSGALNNTEMVEQSLFVEEDEPRAMTEGQGEGLYDLPSPARDRAQTEGTGNEQGERSTNPMPEEDDLDRLLAEEDAGRPEPQQASNNPTTTAQDDFADDMEAMADMDMP